MTVTTENAVARFGAFIKERRLKIGRTARDIAAESGIKPSNLSRMEHGLLKPPQGMRLRDLAAALDLDAPKEVFAKFCDLAAETAEAGVIPLDIREIISDNEAAPLLLRSIGGHKLTQKDINAIVALVHAGSDEHA